ncbi:hypothetical protein H9P43_004312 [Blastocladiella emersonii ATCC 22665]|nr:hypothetical protein H9P43_004312 [Blastocladiella emersonii ATCC 22665]
MSPHPARPLEPPEHLAESDAAAAAAAGAPAGDCATVRDLGTALARNPADTPADAPCCAWKGVACGGDGRVLRITWPQSDLVGTIPEDVVRLRALTVLDLRGNKIFGEVPFKIGDMTALRQLSLSQNNLTGSIPPTISSLSNLAVLDLAGNRLSGTVPSLPLSISACVLPSSAGPSSPFTCYTTPAPAPCVASLGPSVPACPKPFWEQEIVIAIGSSAVAVLAVIIIAVVLCRWDSQRRALRDKKHRLLAQLHAIEEAAAHRDPHAHRASTIVDDDDAPAFLMDQNTHEVRAPSAPPRLLFPDQIPARGVGVVDPRCPPPPPPHAPMYPTSPAGYSYAGQQPQQQHASWPAGRGYPPPPPGWVQDPLHAPRPQSAPTGPAPVGQPPRWSVQSAPYQHPPATESRRVSRATMTDESDAGVPPTPAESNVETLVGEGPLRRSVPGGGDKKRSSWFASLASFGRRGSTQSAGGTPGASRRTSAADSVATTLTSGHGHARGHRHSRGSTAAADIRSSWITVGSSSSHEGGGGGGEYDGGRSRAGTGGGGGYESDSDGGGGRLYLPPAPALYLPPAPALSRPGSAASHSRTLPSAGAAGYRTSWTQALVAAGPRGSPVRERFVMDGHPQQQPQGQGPPTTGRQW